MPEQVTLDRSGAARVRGRRSRSPWRVHRLAHGALASVVVAVFVGSRLLTWAFGISTDGRMLTSAGTWQLLAVDQLKDHLVRSVWYLHSQPPLFNLASGLLLKMPQGAVHPMITVIGLAMGLMLSLATFYLCLELGLGPVIALVVTLVVTIDPANILYQNWYFYSYPTCVLITVAALYLARYLRTRKSRYGIGYVGSAASVVLLNSTFQWIWLIVVIAPVLVLLRHQWRMLVTITALPLLLVGGWYLKNFVLFHVTTTSSWLGMNMARITTMTGPRRTVEQLVAEHKLSPLAAYVAFQPLDYYPARYRSASRTGVAVLDDPTKPGFGTNFNDRAYIGLSSAWLKDDLRFIRYEPRQYVTNVADALRVFFLPAGQYQFLEPNADRIAHYTRAFDVVLDWQPRGTNVDSVNAAVAKGMIPSFGQLSYAAVVVFGLTVLVGPAVAYRRRGSWDGWAMAFIWFSSTYLMVVTMFTELGENERFRLDVGPLPLVAAVVICSAAARAAWRRGSHWGHVRRATLRRCGWREA